MSKTDTPAKVASNDQLGPACDTCSDTGQYAGDSQWYVCMDCDAALRGKVKHSTGPAQALHPQATLDAAVAAERERCACAIEQYGGAWDATTQNFARLIRGLGA